MLRYDALPHISGWSLDGRTRLRHKAADLQSGHDEMITLTVVGNRIVNKILYAVWSKNSTYKQDQSNIKNIFITFLVKNMLKAEGQSAWQNLFFFCLWSTSHMGKVCILKINMLLAPDSFPSAYSWYDIFKALDATMSDVSVS